MRGWRWFIIAAGTLALIHAAGTHTIMYGLLLANLAAVLWAARVHVVQEPRWTIDDELEAVRAWTL